MRKHPTFLRVLFVTTTIATTSAAASMLTACTLSDGGVRPRPGAKASAAAVRPTQSEAKQGNDAALAHGKNLFQHSWTKRDPLSRGGDGLGPNFNASSCTACHNQGGAGGAGGMHGNTFIFNGVMMPKQTDAGFDRSAMGKQEKQRKMIIVDGGSAFADGGLSRQRAVTDLLDLVRPAVQECLAGVKMDNKEFNFKRYELQFDVDTNGRVASDVTNMPIPKHLRGMDKPGTLKAKELACVTKAISDVRLPASNTASTVKWTMVASEVTGPFPTSGQRNPTALFGAGVLDTIKDDVIIANAKQAIEGHPEITGVVPRTDKGEVARFGWKGDVKDLDTFVERACALEVGLEVPGMHQYGFDDANQVGLDLNKDDVHALTQFVRALPRPTKASGTKETERGARLFEKVGCTACHTPNVGGVEGVYSDLLLHDMGAHLADGGGYGGGTVVAKDREWRTPPLWGARDSGPWMHDGRAATLRDAVSSHGGEASVVRDSFEALRDDDQAAVVAFLESLQAS